jgi:ribosomal protein L29
LFLPAFELSERYENDKQIIKYQIENKVKTLEADLEEQTARKTIAETKTALAEKEKIELDPRAQWDKELRGFKNKGYDITFKVFLEKFYQGQRNFYNFVSGDVAIFDAFDLIEINKSDNTIGGLTEKGRYFSRHFSIS